MERIQNIWYLFQSFFCRIILGFKGLSLAGISVNGWINVHGKGTSIHIGKGTVINSGKYKIPVGYPCFTSFWAIDDGKISVGKNCGLSNVTVCSQSEVVIEDRVIIGGGVKIYDTDFHSLDYKIRQDIVGDTDRKSAPVHIGQDVFIGAGSIILKGVTIGERSIVGAGSVVTKSIPKGEIWAGNPAKKIRDVD